MRRIYICFVCGISNSCVKYETGNQISFARYVKMSTEFLDGICIALEDAILSHNFIFFLTGKNPC